MLAQRVAVAIVGTPVIVGLTLVGGPAFSVAAGVVLTVAALEFFSATDQARPEGAPRPPAGQRIAGLPGAAPGALLVAAPHNGREWWTRALALAVVLPFLP